MGAALDLNVDAGEGFGPWSFEDEAGLFASVTSVNVACGFHAGDPRVMDRTVARAVAAGAAIGAHPGHWDLRGFGRREIAADPEEVETDVLYQVGALAAFARSHGTALVHVKPHGALYHQAARDETLARAVARGVRRADATLVLVGLASSSVMRRAAAEAGLRFAGEAFADRAYEADGSLRSRRAKDAIVSDPRAAAEQAVRIAHDGIVVTSEGREIAVHAETLCLHGDTPGATILARAVRTALESAGVAVRPLAR
jgi:5-oxoprolinase (ATP-hydrolysing) subunit A